jgi:hypothetical protein
MGRFRWRGQEGLRIKIGSGLTWTARSLLPLSRSQPAGPEAKVEPKKKPEGLNILHPVAPRSRLRGRKRQQAAAVQVLGETRRTAFAMTASALASATSAFSLNLNVRLPI